MWPSDSVTAAIRLLEGVYGVPERHPLGNVLDSLIVTILSQNTTDLNRDRAFARLKEAFPTWEEAIIVGAEGVEKAIRPGGLARVKASRILRLLEDLKVSHGEPTLEWLRGLAPQEAERVLLSMPGVGMKTARCVLLFELGHPAFPVDTHVLRVAKRLGWLEEQTTASKAHEIMNTLIPPESMHSLHINMIRLGRMVCRPRRPLCASCPLREECRYGNLNG